MSHTSRVRLVCIDHVVIRLVLEQLPPLPQYRKCFRLISGVLVERTIQEVTVTLKATSANLKSVLEDLLKQYKQQQDEREKWKVWHNGIHWA